MAIRITITGPAAVGKTTVGRLIAKMLEAEGYSVEHFQQPATLRPTEGLMSVQIEECNSLRHLRERSL